ncbi:MAG TPA: hypothetical protein VL598_02480 [Trinickia sp.]|jgi:hypothetical protein|uniref:hypothetical protein n=1 Tax=Trinickia sp. TaxID=2571163 RepID=UPI002BF27ABA|nr:hypothetical protein [Trinickia sp.]HTI16513.1 hypothetical protein [Trinickia sp.]
MGAPVSRVNVAANTGEAIANETARETAVFAILLYLLFAFNALFLSIFKFILTPSLGTESSRHKATNGAYSIASREIYPMEIRYQPDRPAPCTLLGSSHLHLAALHYYLATCRWPHNVCR